MEKSLHEEIVYSTEFEIINSPAFYDCVIHLICNEGSGCFTYNENIFAVKKGDVAVLSHPNLIKDISKTEDFACEYIAAPDKFLHNLLSANNYSIQGSVSLFENPIINVNSYDADRFRADIANIHTRIEDTEHRFYHELMGSLLQTMIYDLFDFHVKSNDSVLTTDRVGYITSQFFAMIGAGRPKTERDVSYYAAMLNVTPKYLSDTIKRVTGASASSHISRAATSIILAYLRDNKMSITQIADEMNFTSLSYFSRYCVKHIGMSPARFRTSGTRNFLDRKGITVD